MYQCVDCGTTEKLLKNRNICRKCQYAKETRSKAYSLRKELTKDKLMAIYTILNQYIILWESKTLTRSQAECLYIDCCKALGRDRKPKIMEDWEKLQQAK